MELRQLRYFVAVAEELHFSRAAVRLSLAQSALSAQIRQLEAELGGPLLVRTTRKVELTPAGEALLTDARRMIALAEEATLRARALARGEAGALVIGSLGPAPGGVLAPVLALFSSRHPDVRVELRAFDFTEVVSGLRERRADVAFLYEPLDEPDFHVTPLFSEQRVVVLPRTHRLADRDELRPEDLRGETFVVQPECVPPAWRDFWLLVDELGERPPVSPLIGETLEEWLHLIGRGEGIDTAPALISRYYAWPEVRFVPLAGAAPATMVLARRRDSEHPLLGEFTEMAQTVSHTAVSHPTTPYSATPSFRSVPEVPN
ncbi:MAG TPA: LysR substrate-binding domain-containing protein [Capillimicrobium sp.]